MLDLALITLPMTSRHRRPSHSSSNEHYLATCLEHGFESMVMTKVRRGGQLTVKSVEALPVCPASVTTSTWSRERPGVSSESLKSNMVMPPDVHLPFRVFCTSAPSRVSTHEG